MISKSVRVTGATVATALVGGVLAATPAQALSTYQGKVTASSGLTVRHLPTTASAAKGTVAKGTTVEIVCKVRGSSVGGNTIWYALPPTLNEWVSARYVENVGPAPRWCGTDERFVGRTTATLTKRVAPTTAAASAGAIARGAAVRVVCKLDGQSVAGNKRWYYLTDGKWVAARYVINVGRAPGWCN